MLHLNFLVPALSKWINSTNPRDPPQKARCPCARGRTLPPAPHVNAMISTVSRPRAEEGAGERRGIEIACAADISVGAPTEIVRGMEERWVVHWLYVPAWPLW